MRARFGVSEAVVAQFGPSVLARNDVGVGDANLGADRNGHPGPIS